MKIAIIGAGNMGGAMARGLSRGTVVAAADIWVADPSTQKLADLQAFNPALKTTADNQQAVSPGGYQGRIEDGKGGDRFGRQPELRRHPAFRDSGKSGNGAACHIRK